MRRSFLNFGWAALISILSGIIILWILNGSLNVSPRMFIWNTGYSFTLGTSLFANGYLFRWFEKKYIFWIDRPIRSLFNAVSMHVIYSSAAIFLVNYVWFILWTGYSWEDFWVFGKQIIISEYIVFVIIASIIYAISFFKAWKGKWQEAEQLKIEALSLKYQVLQNQVNPHFLFNSLNVLGSLIDIDVDKAKTFTRELSMFYRDVLHFKDQEIVSLKEEIDFVRKYIYLQEIRFGEAFNVEFCISPKVEANVIPLSLQMLVENAIKHNEISVQKPLKVIIAITDDYELIVENNVQLRKVPESSKKGLMNLAARYEFLTGKKVVIFNDENYFRVTLPLIKMEGQNQTVWD